MAGDYAPIAAPLTLKVCETVRGQLRTRLVGWSPRRIVRGDVRLGIPSYGPDGQDQVLGLNQYLVVRACSDLGYLLLSRSNAALDSLPAALAAHQFLRVR